MAVAMTTAFYVIKTYQSVFERRMRTLQFRSPGIAPGNADESAQGMNCLSCCAVLTVVALTVSDRAETVFL